jgi:hypothetical protein
MNNISLIVTHQKLTSAALTIWRSEIAQSGDQCIYVHYNQEYPEKYAYCIIPPYVKQKMVFNKEDYFYSKHALANSIEGILASQTQNNFNEMFCEGNLTKTGNPDITEEAKFFARRFSPETLYIFTETPECVAAWYDHWSEELPNVPAYAGSQKEIKEIKSAIPTPRTTESQQSSRSIMEQPNDNYSLKLPDEESTMQLLAASLTRLFSDSPKATTPQIRTSEERKTSFDSEDIDNIPMKPNPLFVRYGPHTRTH